MTNPYRTPAMERRGLLIMAGIALVAWGLWEAWGWWSAQIDAMEPLFQNPDWNTVFKGVALFLPIFAFLDIIKRF